MRTGAFPSHALIARNKISSQCCCPDHSCSVMRHESRFSTRNEEQSRILSEQNRANRGRRGGSNFEKVSHDVMTDDNRFLNGQDLVIPALFSALQREDISTFQDDDFVFSPAADSFCPSGSPEVVAEIDGNDSRPSSFDSLPSPTAMRWVRNTFFHLPSSPPNLSLSSLASGQQSPNNNVDNTSWTKVPSEEGRRFVSNHNGDFGSDNRGTVLRANPSSSIRARTKTLDTFDTAVYDSFPKDNILRFIMQDIQSREDCKERVPKDDEEHAQLRAQDALLAYCQDVLRRNKVERQGGSRRASNVRIADG